jgi:hypothetical protein
MIGKILAHYEIRFQYLLLWQPEPIPALECDNGSE